MTRAGTLAQAQRPRALITVRPEVAADAAAQRCLLDEPLPRDLRLLAARMFDLSDLSDLAHIPDEAAGTSLVALRGAFPAPELVGMARLIVDPEQVVAEFALIVRPSARGHGIGRLLLDALMTDARRRGLLLMRSVALADNAPMLALARASRFQALQTADGTVELVRTLAPRQRGRW